MGRKRVLAGERIRLVLQCQLSAMFACAAPHEDSSGARIEKRIFECSMWAVDLASREDEANCNAFSALLLMLSSGIACHHRLPSMSQYAIYVAMNVQGTGGNLLSRTRRMFLMFRRRTCPSACDMEGGQPFQTHIVRTSAGRIRIKSETNWTRLSPSILFLLLWRSTFLSGRTR